MSSRAVLAALIATLATAGVAGAVPLQQPNGATIPSPMGCDGGQPTGLAAELACECDTAGCNIGTSCALPGPCARPTGTCETTLWHAPNDNTCIPSLMDGLDPWQDGALTPETYTPTCPLTFEVVSRGTARFKNIFGWYNVTGQRPAQAELYPMLDCNTAPGAEIVLDVRTDPRWAGGEIGFFLATPEQHGAGGTGGTAQCAGGDCCARVDRLPDVGFVYYSQRDLNPDQSGAQSIIHLVVYDSAITERKFYFAWEDTFNAANNDFTDLVTSVRGVECAGGGAACDTGRPGMCKYGVTKCEGASIACVQVVGETGESCDGADNDCDGMIDEGLGCENLIGECADVTCPDGLICKQGQCIDNCVNVQCGAGLTCFSGVCLPGCNQCNGVVCPGGRTCDLDSGACLGGPGNDPDAGTGADSDAGNSDDGDGDGGLPSGCCQGGAEQGAGGWLVLGLGGLGLARRRRRRVTTR